MSLGPRLYHMSSVPRGWGVTDTDNYDHEGLVHSIGIHKNTVQGRQIFADCGTNLGIAHGIFNGFLKSNTDDAVTCMVCIAERSKGPWHVRR